jgi:ADP-ribosylglycohydrolase
MIGAIAGDIIGSVYESDPIKTKNFPLFHPHCRFTDDSVLTIAVADAILSGDSYEQSVHKIGQQYPDAGYGGSFIDWLNSDYPEPYNSWGNGAAMRVSPVGFAFSSEDNVLCEAEKTAIISHNHPEGIKGAQATALSIFLARTGKSKEDIRKQISRTFDYDLHRTVNDIRPTYSFDISCQGNVPEAIIAFLDSTSYEDALRNAISLGGDSDTLACITGGISEAFYKEVPDTIQNKVREILTQDLLVIVERFLEKYMKL